jgi:hypothetical protein
VLTPQIHSRDTNENDQMDDIFLAIRKIHMDTLSRVTDFIIPYVRCRKLYKPHRTVNITPTESSRMYETWGKRPMLEAKNNS